MTLQTRETMIVNKLGLHARAAAKLVSVANGYGADVLLIKDGQQVNGKSIMGVMMLAASRGTVLQLQVDGEGEDEAMQALVALIEDKFGEGE
jgi:phosphocarrier protein